MGIDRCPRRGERVWGGLPLSTAYLGNYVCHVCPFARFISHHPSAFTFRARTLLFFRLKLAYTAFVRTETRMSQMLWCSLSLPSIRSGCTTRFLTIRPDGGGVSFSGADASSLTTLCKIRSTQPQPLTFDELDGNHTFEIRSSHFILSIKFIRNEWNAPSSSVFSEVF